MNSIDITKAHYREEQLIYDAVKDVIDYLKTMIRIKEMQIIINKINENIVYFKTKYGNGKGVWKDDHIPHLGEYDVEIGIQKIISTKDVEVVQPINCIQILNDKISFTMKLIDYEQSGCATCLLGESIIEFETIFDEGFYKLKNKFLKLSVDQLEIYPFKI